jgi:hypothetical protein
MVAAKVEWKAEELVVHSVVRWELPWAAQMVEHWVYHSAEWLAGSTAVHSVAAMVVKTAAAKAEQMDGN